MKKLCIKIGVMLFVFVTTYSIYATPASNLIADPKNSVAYKWLDIALEVTANDVDRVGAKPTVQSRQLGIVVNTIYDAWAVYDAKAIGTQFGGKLRRPAAERTQKNKEIAISYAIYRVLMDQYKDDAKYITAEFVKMGYKPENR